MKLKTGFALIDLAGEYVAVPVGDAAEKIHGIIRLNETGKLIWEMLTEGQGEAQIAEKILAEYDGVEPETAKAHVHKIVEKLRENRLIED